MRKLSISVSPVLLIAVLALVIAIASCSLELSRRNQDGQALTASGTATLPEGVPPEFNRVFEVWGVLKREHFLRETLDGNELSQGAVRGMLQALDDPYASYLTAQQYSMESQDLQGFFEGIGAEVTMRDGKLTIVAPIPDTPADRAGIRPGDIILEINGESTDGLSLLEAVNRIRGTKGEPVDLLVLHKTGGDPVPLTIIRDVIQVKSVILRMLVGRIAHLRITTFADTTTQELAEALDKVKDFDARGIILDVRNNPGGGLRTVVNVTGQFVDGGLVLYELDGRGERKDWKVKSGGLASDIPLVLLVNEFSASGSEVLAGAIMDHQRAPVIGSKTFGKGSVNTLRPLSDGAGLYYTIARWHTPNGTQIEGEGLEPNIVIEQPEDGVEDLQLDKAMEVLEAQVKALEEKG